MGGIVAGGVARTIAARGRALELLAEERAAKMSCVHTGGTDKSHHGGEGVYLRGGM